MMILTSSMYSYKRSRWRYGSFSVYLTLLWNVFQTFRNVFPKSVATDFDKNMLEMCCDRFWKRDWKLFFLSNVVFGLHKERSGLHGRLRRRLTRWLSGWIHGWLHWWLTLYWLETFVLKNKNAMRRDFLLSSSMQTLMLLIIIISSSSQS